MSGLEIEIYGASDRYELLYAEGGEIELLAKLIENGGDLGPETRKWLAAHLRGKLPKKRGNKRLWSQVEREMGIVRLIRHFQYNRGKFDLALRKLSKKEIRRLANNEEEGRRFCRDNRGEITENAAVELYLEMVEGAVPRETVRTYLRKDKERRRVRGW
jgi:hypothetical protein